MKHRVVITGMGCVTPLGDSASAIRHSVQTQRTAFRRSAIMPDVAESPVPDFNCADYAGRWKHTKYLSRGAQFALAAAVRAMEDAMGHATPHSLPAVTGLYLGTGPNLDIVADFPRAAGVSEHGLPTATNFSGPSPKNHALSDLDHADLSALWLLRYLPNTAASAIAQRLGLHGENATLGTACAASLMALGTAFRAIRDGYQNMALAGGGDSRLSSGGLLGYRKASALCDNPDLSAEAASRPFDAQRCGFVPAEGGAMFLLEERDHALQRGARILAEVLGYGNSLDGHAMTAPEPDGHFAELAVSTALREAGLPPQAVDMISAHGTSTPLNDAAEGRLLERVFGTCSPDIAAGNKRESAVSEPEAPHTNSPLILAPKSWIGHGAAACGALELAFCLATLPHGVVPPVRNLVSPTARLRFAGQTNLVRHPEHIRQTENSGQTKHPETLLLQNFGFGGQNAALLVRLHSGVQSDSVNNHDEPARHPNGRGQ
ncbi:beta-ketoacyl-[acyl-carrier-protein] synthase family protein [Desulfovibrio subterraneus]|uniref:beta-ketoacyl-[acyl-carrier-protein] synthase family protein n=1 Tax=Desulfovibrio subterraneus TaxID=2718620 RepID=UPI0022B8D583|nr:beta-ketoacyl-[acyl-carrier-protein] synthase family protein [Desulfovibrio subterraneus]WBF66127.1 beta-ketoacyl-[acyl-carrier-protein] synthase family protein [Desulfovibrio subterraneus]